MKKIISNITFVAISIFLIIAFSGCAKKTYTVTYDYNNGKELDTVSYEEGSVLNAETPKKSGYVFVGWCTDAELSNFYDFNAHVNSDLTLYAKWTLDYEKIISSASREAASFCVKIICANGKSAGNGNVISQGSGVVYDKKDEYYYVLTNNHVISEAESNSNGKIYVYDAYGYEYAAEFIRADASYDLAILKIKEIKDVSLGKAKIKSETPGINETVVSITSPKGQINAIEIGQVAAVKSVTQEGSQTDESKVTFDVMWLTAYSNNGSSGGAILDTDMNLVGIVYGVATTSSGSFGYTFAIPGEKISEFLK